jgi:hypothetical protein
MNDKSRLDKLISIFIEYLTILENQNGGQFLRAIRGLLGTLNDEKCPLDQRLKEAQSLFKTLMGGAGTLGDFAIWHADDETRVNLNKNLSRMEGEISHLLVLGLSHLPDVDEGYPCGHSYWSIKDPKGEVKE